MIRFKINNGSAKTRNKPRFRVSDNSVNMMVEKTSVVSGIRYEGDYEVTPKTTEQTLYTKYKTMYEDLTVKAIPRYDVSNLAGGKTIYIANEV
jgi:hypothetical protein